MLFCIVLSDHVLIYELFDLYRFFYLDMIHVKGRGVASLFFLHDIIRLLCAHITDETIHTGNQKIYFIARSSAK